MNPMRRNLSALALFVVCLAATTATAEFPAMGVAPKAGGFRMDGYWVWCGSVIKSDDGK